MHSPARCCHRRGAAATSTRFHAGGASSSSSPYCCLPSSDSPLPHSGGFATPVERGHPDARDREGQKENKSKDEKEVPLAQRLWEEREHVHPVASVTGVVSRLP